MRRRIVLAMFLAAITCSASRGQGFVEHFEPPVLQRGKTTRVSVVGSGLGKTVGLWASVPGIKATPIETTQTKAVLDLQVAADAPVGICGVRLSTVDGLANACLVLVDDLPVQLFGAKAELPVALWGRFREATVDRVQIEVTAGQRVSFEAVGSRLGKDVDPLVTIRNTAGKIVAERDNDPGLYFDCRFEHVFAERGTYTVEIRDARYHGSKHGFYVLRMGKFPAAQVALPAAVQLGQRIKIMLPSALPNGDTTAALETPKDQLGLFFGTVKRPGDEGSAWIPFEASDAYLTIHQAPGDSMESGTPAKVPGVLCGILQKPGARHFYRLDLGKGQRIQVRAEARAFNSPADLEIAITDAKGKELRRATENQQEEILLDFNAGAPGIYGLSVRDLNRDGDPTFSYRLEVAPPRPRIQVNAEVEGLTVPRGDYQPVPLTVTRSDYAGKIALKLVGAPAGVTLTPSEIDAGVNGVVCKLEASSDAPLGLATLQILATPADAKEPVSTLVRTKPLIDRQIVNVDLIPLALREDQRRLPPSLADRFALQVTPPSFFTFRLPESLVTLGRYQHAEYPIETTVQPGADPRITFSAKGGQIAPKEEGRTRVYAEFAGGKGSIHSKILTNLTKHRVEVTGSGVRDGRRISLTRTFDLDVRAAYAITAEPTLLKLLPGETGKVRLHADRLKTFDGAVTLQISPVLGLVLPETVTIPRGQSAIDVTVTVDAARPAGRQQVQFNATAQVNGLEEEQRGRFEIDILKMPPKKKIN
ncbi:MAG TPA: hypothetical protein VFE62_16455 [Gemmataceae bacterium]|nr:hypothetical protein [Gemmataceae bacterium]